MWTVGDPSTASFDVDIEAGLWAAWGQRGQRPGVQIATPKRAIRRAAGPAGQHVRGASTTGGGGSCLEPRSGGQPHAGSLPVHCSRGPVSWSRAQPRHGGLARWKPRRACHTAVVARHRRSGAGSGGQGARIHTPRPPASTPPPPVVTRAGGR